MTRSEALERASWLSENTGDTYSKLVNDIYDNFNKEKQELITTRNETLQYAEKLERAIEDEIKNKSGFMTCTK